VAIGVGSRRLDPVRGYNFVVSLVDTSSALGTLVSGIQNVVLGGFSECSGLETEMRTEDYEEGGNNGTVLHFPKRVSWTHLHLKRGAALSDELWNWYYGFVQGRGKRRDGIVMLQDDEHTPVKIWFFTRGLPVKWTGPSLNALQSQVAIEELEIAHEGLQVHTPGSVIGGLVKSIF
jgi:phage tail-like protein